MRITASLRLVGLLLMLFSVTQLPPLLVTAWYGDGHSMPFIVAFFITLGTGFILWRLFFQADRELRTRDGFLVVVLLWVVLSFFGALPLMLAVHPHMNFTNAVFETVSGLSTTGATVLVGLDKLPHAILYYRAQLQWLGGMGIIVLAVAVLPSLGIGGLQLYRAEITGPIKDSKLTPRITETAKALWLVYVGLSVACIATYWLFGMSAFDALTYGFSTISTGGYAPHDASMAYYPSITLQLLCCLFMWLGALNFTLHFVALRRRSVRPYWQDRESRLYCLIIGVITIVLAVVLLSHHQYDVKTSFFHGFFHILSLGSTTGFVVEKFSLWPSFLPIMIIFSEMIGGCAGSTSGGLKVIRVLLLYKQARRELQRLIHPNAELPLKVGPDIIQGRITDAVWGFLGLFAMIFVLLLLLLLAFNLDFNTAFTGLVACIANAGPGLGAVADNFVAVHGEVKWIFIFAMLVGRLEIFTVFLLFMPSFWRD